MSEATPGVEVTFEVTLPRTDDNIIALQGLSDTLGWNLKKVGEDTPITLEGLQEVSNELWGDPVYGANVVTILCRPEHYSRQSSLREWGGARILTHGLLGGIGKTLDTIKVAADIMPAEEAIQRKSYSEGFAYIDYAEFLARLKVSDLDEFIQSRIIDAIGQSVTMQAICCTTDNLVNSGTHGERFADVVVEGACHWPEGGNLQFERIARHSLAQLLDVHSAHLGLDRHERAEGALYLRQYS